MWHAVLSRCRMPAAGSTVPRRAWCKHSCTLFIGLASSTFLLKQWLDFSRELTLFKEQRPAVCLGGRMRNESMSQARFQVDDFEHDQESTLGRINCRFQVYVYPCTDPAERRCSAASATAEPVSRWRLSFDYAGVRCARPGSWTLAGSTCDKAAWRCGSKPCNAYQKAAGECVTILDSRPYACHYVPGDVTAGISTEPFEYPLLSGVFAAVVTVLLLACAQDFIRKALVSACEDDCSSLLRVLLGLCLIFATAVATMQTLLVMPGLVRAPLGARAFEGGFWGAALREAAPWQAEVEQDPWQDMILIMSALLGACIFIALLALATRRLLCDARDARGGGAETFGPAE